MRKAWCLILAAAMIISNASFVLADNDVGATEERVYETEIAEISETTEAYDESDADVDLFAAVDGIVLEYDDANSTDLTRWVKVKYNQDYFTSGINSFNVQIGIPSRYANGITKESRLTGFEWSDSYENGVYTCTATSGTDKVPVDGTLFTMKIALSDYLTEPLTISITGNTSIGDSTGITQNLANGGMNEASVTLPVMGADDPSGQDGAVTWRVTGDTLYIHGSGTMNAYEKETAPWYSNSKVDISKIKKIVFSDGEMQNIGKCAFYGFYNVEQISLSSEIRTINESAFEGCSKLTSINLTDSARTGIGNYAFKNCTSLTSFIVPDSVSSIGQGAFEGCTKLVSITLPFVGSQQGDGNSYDVFPYIFNSNVPQALKTVTITRETRVPASAFEGCEYLEQINLNNSVTAIGNATFKGCTRLKSFTIPSSVTAINAYTFQNCSNITSIDITDNIKSIGAGAFDGCAKLESIYVPQITAIEDYTFRNCSTLTKIEIPTTVTRIGEGVLAGCTKLIDVSVPFVGANANPGATAVTNEGKFGYFFGVTDNSQVPASVTKVEVTSTDRSGYIPKEAFKNCGNIVDIIVYGGRNILDNAFVNCRNLKTLKLPKSISTIGSTILEGNTNLVTLTVPFIGSDRNDTGKETSVLGGFFGYDQQNQTYTKQYYNDNGDYHFYKIPKTLKNVFVLNQTSIPTGAFSECDFIENVSVVTGARMNKQAFYHCYSLETVTLPDDLTTIGEEAFAECENLKEINIPTKVRSIGENAFYNDRALVNVTMPDSVTEIADTVFNGTDMYSAGEVQLMATGLTITCSEGSEAYKFATAKGIPTNVVLSSELSVTDINADIAKLSDGGYTVEVTDTHKLVGTVYVAIYDNAGRLLSVKNTAATADGLNYILNFTKEEAQGAAKVKVFVWNNKLQSLTDEAKTITEIPA